MDLAPGTERTTGDPRRAAKDKIWPKFDATPDWGAGTTCAHPNDMKTLLALSVAISLSAVACAGQTESVESGSNAVTAPDNFAGSVDLLAAQATGKFSGLRWDEDAKSHDVSDVTAQSCILQLDGPNNKYNTVSAKIIVDGNENEGRDLTQFTFDLKDGVAQPATGATDVNGGFSEQQTSDTLSYDGRTLTIKRDLKVMSGIGKLRAKTSSEDDVLTVEMAPGFNNVGKVTWKRIDGSGKILTDVTCSSWAPRNQP
jgi:hypothetical protein